MICYKGMYIEADFEINLYRDEFDSIEESQINDILHSEFKNVIYNQRNNERTITLVGCVPDWVVFTEKGCYVIEYFGLYVDRKSSNRMIDDYKEKTHNKIEKYEELDGYKFVYIYPEDLGEDFKGVRDKIGMIS